MTSKDKISVSTMKREPRKNHLHYFILWKYLTAANRFACYHRYLFDWNGAFKFGPNVPIHVEGENENILPPEAWKDGNETHVTVSGTDVYAAGILLSQSLCGVASCRPVPPREKNEQLWQAHDLAARMLTANPHERPATEELLKHPFVQI